MDLDKLFPKLIACDDKQVNIYLVEVRNWLLFFKSNEKYAVISNIYLLDWFINSECNV